MNEKTASEKAARNMAVAVNSFSFRPKEFCREMESAHRTLQQTFTGLCLEWLKTCAREDYRYDGRNEASHIVCVKLSSCWEKEEGQTNIPFEDIHLPLV